MKRAKKVRIALTAVILVIIAITAIFTHLIAGGAEWSTVACVAVMLGSALGCFFLIYGILLYAVATSKE